MQSRLTILERHQTHVLSEVSELKKDLRNDSKALWHMMSNQLVSLEKLKSSLATIKHLLTAGSSSVILLYLFEKFTD